MGTPDGIVDRADSRGGSNGAVQRGMGGNLLWYIPLFCFVVWYFALSNARAGYENIGIVFRHWTWVLLVSPSAYVFFVTVVYSVFLPVHFMLFIPYFFSSTDPATYDRRYLFSVLVVVALVILVFATQLVIQGSFPLCWQSNGVERIRLVPLMSCPK